MSDDPGKDANDLLLALARAGRSFLLYDPGNEAIRGFLEDYRDSWTRYSEAHGDLELGVRPFELVRADKVVYLERDRERSLAFKMFRDGVRTLSIGQHATWDELLRLLQILSIRFTGIRQQEDDLVTLLWKAGFKNIDVHAVEGFIPDEEDDEDEGLDAEVEHLVAPEDQDRPHPVFASRGTVEFTDIDLEAQVQALAEADSRHLAEDALRLAELLLQLVRDPTDRMEAMDLHFYLDELRDFLMAEEQIGRLVRLVRMLQAHLEHDPLVLEENLGRLTETEALLRIVRSIQKNHQSAPPELLDLLHMLPGDHLKHLIDVLASERDQGSRRILRQLVEPFVAGRERWFMDQILSAKPEVAIDLVRSAGHTSPDMLITLAPELVARADEGVVGELLWQADRIGRSLELDHTLLQLVDSDFERVRIRTMKCLAKRLYVPAFGPIAARAEVGSVSTEECEAIGETLATLDRTESGLLFNRWIRPGGGIMGLFGSKGSDTLCWTAAAGLEHLDEPKDDKLLEWLAKRAGEDLYARCRRALVKRRQRREGRDG